MATITVSREDLFPNGTTVNAYEAVGLGRTPTSGAPTGSSAGSASVSGGVLEITGLDSDKAYILYASSPDRYLRATTMETASGGGGTGDVTEEMLEDAIAAHAADTTSVHGISDTSALATDSDVTSAISSHASDTTAVHGISDTAFIKGVAVDTDGGVVSRPDFLSVEFVQADDPDALAEEGDTWTPTEAP